MKGGIPRKGLIAHWQNSDVSSQIIMVSTFLSISENSFQDIFVRHSTSKYSQTPQVPIPSTVPSFVIRHGSKPTAKRTRCAICHHKASRFCPDCPSQPHLCQLLSKCCNDIWHSPQYEAHRHNPLKRHHHLPVHHQLNGADLQEA